MNINIYGIINARAYELKGFLDKVGVNYYDEKADDGTMIIRIPGSKPLESIMLSTTLNDSILFSDYKTNMRVSFHVSDFERLTLI